MISTLDSEAENAEYEKKMVGFIQGLGYDKIQKLGEGGMGMAYRGRYLKDGTVRVLKVNKSKSDTADDELKEEGTRLKSLSHPHVAVLYGLQSSAESGSGFSYLNMEFCRGGDLHHRCLALSFHAFDLMFLSLGFKFGVWVSSYYYSMFQASGTMEIRSEFRIIILYYCG